MSTITEDKHRMTSKTPTTAARELSQPSHTQGKNSVLSEPMCTDKSKQLDHPLRNQCKSNLKQLKQSKPLSGLERSPNISFNPDRRYYKPSTDTKTYFVNSQGHLQSRGEPPDIIKTNGKGKVTDSKESPLYHEPGSIVINNKQELWALYPNSFDRLGSLKGEYNIKIDPTVDDKQHSRRSIPF